MTIYFSKSTNGFYDNNAGVAIPNDAVITTSAIRDSLLGQQSETHGISSDANGNPILVYINTTPEQIQGKLQLQAKMALDTSDVVVIRCYAAGVPLPVAWSSYRAALRAIVNATDTISTVLPAKPQYPAGT